MAKFVCNGAQLKCSMGSAPSALGVIHPVKPVKIGGQPMAGMMDHKPVVNIKPFGQCKSLANPTVAAATAANYGRLQPMPCVPNTTTPWIGAKMNVFVKGNPAVLDDGKLECIDDHPDTFEGEEPQKINVKKLREGLRLLGYDTVKEDGPFDDTVEHAFLTYHWRHGRVQLELACAEDEDPKKPLDRLADKYGIATWKYLDEEYEGVINHDAIKSTFDPTHGDNLLKEKIEEKELDEYITPAWFKPGIAYHYVWVPHCINIKNDDDDELKKLYIYNRTTGQVIAEQDLKEEDGKYVAEMIVPNLPKEDAIYLIDDKVMLPDVPEVIEADQIIEMYWTYDDECKQRVESKVENDRFWKSKYIYDLNFHVVVKDGNNGRLLRYALKDDDGEIINLQKTVSGNEVVFEKVFNKNRTED